MNNSIIWAFIGGIALEFIHWYGKRRDPQMPVYARSIKYWLITALMIVFGCIITYLMQLQRPLTQINSFALGFAAPSVIHKIAIFLPKDIYAGAKNNTVLPSIRSFLT